MSLIILQQVTRTYQVGAVAVTALRNVDLTIEPGDFVAVWGPSGSGKSTLCNLIGVLDTPTSGMVTINGKDVTRLSDAEQSAHRNSCVGFIFQSYNLIRVLSALENVMMPLSLRGETTAACRELARNMLVELGLEEHLHHLPDQLSGGQQQRVAIARALVTRPLLVVADEPTANLDTETAEKIVDLMRQFNATLGTTFIFSTHDQRLLGRVCRQIRLRDGEIVGDVRYPSGAMRP